MIQGSILSVFKCTDSDASLKTGGASFLVSGHQEAIKEDFAIKQWFRYNKGERREGMRQTPANLIEETAVSAWRLTAVLYLIIPVALLAGSIAAFVYISWPWWVIAIAVSLLIIDIIFFVFLIPRLRWRRWRYEVFEQEVYIQHGIIIRRRTLVPMLRVQHVDTKQGPILKKFSLATVTISTAATTHEIPALTEEEASGLRDRISELARVEENDV